MMLVGGGDDDGDDDEDNGAIMSVVMMAMMMRMMMMMRRRRKRIVIDRFPCSRPCQPAMSFIMMMMLRRRRISPSSSQMPDNTNVFLFKIIRSALYCQFCPLRLSFLPKQHVYDMASAYTETLS